MSNLIIERARSLSMTERLKLEQRINPRGRMDQAYLNLVTEAEKYLRNRDHLGMQVNAAIREASGYPTASMIGCTTAAYGAALAVALWGQLDDDILEALIAPWIAITGHRVDGRPLRQVLKGVRDAFNVPKQLAMRQLGDLIEAL